jgi:hypothetical protein
MTQTFPRKLLTALRHGDGSGTQILVVLIELWDGCLKNRQICASSRRVEILIRPVGDEVLST